MCLFSSIAKYGHSDHETELTIEFTSKNHSRTYLTLMCLPVLPYIVTSIMKWTSLLNSHKKTTQEVKMLNALKLCVLLYHILLLYHMRLVLEVDIDCLVTWRLSATYNTDILDTKCYCLKNLYHHSTQLPNWNIWPSDSENTSHWICILILRTFYLSIGNTETIVGCLCISICGNLKPNVLTHTMYF